MVHGFSLYSFCRKIVCYFGIILLSVLDRRIYYFWFLHILLWHVLVICQHFVNNNTTICQFSFSVLQKIQRQKGRSDRTRGWSWKRSEDSICLPGKASIVVFRLYFVIITSLFLGSSITNFWWTILTDLSEGRRKRCIWFLLKSRQGWYFCHWFLWC